MRLQRVTVHLFRSIEHAVVEVTEAVLGQDGGCLPGREPNPDFVEVCVLASARCQVAARTR